MRLHHRPGRGGGILGAVMLIVIGCMFLAPSIIPDFSPGEVLHRGWPIILIAMGVFSLIGNIVRAPFRGRLDIAGPAILTTVGILFALQTFGDVGFHRTWPVMLVVIGIVLVVKRLASSAFLPFARRWL